MSANFFLSFSTFYYEITTEEVICNNKLYNNIFHKSGVWNIQTEDMFPSVIFNIDWTIWVKWFDQKKGLKTQKCTNFSSGQICHQMHVAKFLKTEIILVTDSIAWVRCNSGNCWYFNVVFFFMILWWYLGPLKFWPCRVNIEHSKYCQNAKFSRFNVLPPPFPTYSKVKDSWIYGKDIQMWNSQSGILAEI